MAHDERLTVRLSPEDLARLDALRAPLGLSRSACIRWLLRDAERWAQVMAKLDALATPRPPLPAPAPSSGLADSVA
ncbi:MAG: ribbon-helix-helix protein, CopG family, partial [Firmicutes bacterium]|nr:ribbon-helix-helix protein, CopG family [Bacillota bacterium]